MKRPSAKATSKASDMAGQQIDELADSSATVEERQKRKRRLLKGPQNSEISAGISPNRRADIRRSKSLCRKLRDTSGPSTTSDIRPPSATKSRSLRFGLDRDQVVHGDAVGHALLDIAQH
jgi:hypothetical protein